MNKRTNVVIWLIRFFWKNMTFITHQIWGFSQKRSSQRKSRWKTVSILLVKCQKAQFSTCFVNILVFDRNFIEFQGFLDPKKQIFQPHLALQLHSHELAPTKHKHSSSFKPEKPSFSDHFFINLILFNFHQFDLIYRY